MLHLFQPHFLILSTTFVVCTYINNLVPFYTDILFMIMPVEVWKMIAIGQYVFPVIILAKIHAPLKAWWYMVLYPLFVYSWIPITFVGFLHRNDREWSHTQHTRSISYREVPLLATAEDYPKENYFGKQAAK